MQQRNIARNLISRTLGTTSHHRQKSPGNELRKHLDAHADIAIIGGGVVGTSLVYHLAKQSNKKIILLEKTELTAGSTWHAAGLVTLYHPGINIKNLHWHSLNFYAQLEKETGLQIGFHQPGSLRLATNQVRLDEMKYQMSRAGWNKTPQKLVTPEECLELCPLIDLGRQRNGRPIFTV